jgi:hypothetical protein
VRAGGIRFTITRGLEQGQLVKRIAVKDGEEEHLFEERVAALMPEQVEALVREAGFAVRERTDGPEPTPFDPARAQRLVVWAQRPLA